MDGRKLRITGWVMSAVLAFFLIGPSAIGKFIDWEGKDKMFEHLGYTQELIFKLAQGFAEPNANH